MKIEHIAIWTEDLELMKDFYVKYFEAKHNNRYFNSNKQFQSYFLSFNSGCRIEIMNKPNIVSAVESSENQTSGLAHFAFSVGSAAAVDELIRRLRNDGYRIVGQPRVTGDGYYEGIVLDPEGNQIEITE
jgi:lactoylglutathione lyase